MVWYVETEIPRVLWLVELHGMLENRAVWWVDRFVTWPDKMSTELFTIVTDVFFYDLSARIPGWYIHIAHDSCPCTFWPNCFSFTSSHLIRRPVPHEVKIASFSHILNLLAFLWRLHVLFDAHYLMKLKQHRCVSS